MNSIVLVSLQAETAALAAQRGYLPAHVRLLKRIAAIAPQAVCIADHHVRIDGRCPGRRPQGSSAAVLAAMPAAGTGRTLPARHDQSRVVRQPLFRPGPCLRRARHSASDLAGDTSMRAIMHRAHARQPCVIEPTVAGRVAQTRRALAARFPCADVALCMHRPDGRRSRPSARQNAVRAGRQKAKAEGKTKGCGTGPRRKPVCTWGKTALRVVHTVLRGALKRFLPGPSRVPRTPVPAVTLWRQDDERSTRR